MDKKVQHKNQYAYRLAYLEDNYNQKSKGSLQLSSPCPKCGHDFGIIEPKPADYIHAAALRCEQCDRFIKWISKKEFSELSNQKQSAVGGTK